LGIGDRHDLREDGMVDQLGPASAHGRELAAHEARADDADPDRLGSRHDAAGIVKGWGPCCQPRGDVRGNALDPVRDSLLAEDRWSTSVIIVLSGKPGVGRRSPIASA
jgi:hypothetical protein